MQLFHQNGGSLFNSSLRVNGNINGLNGSLKSSSQITSIIRVIGKVKDTQIIVIEMKASLDSVRHESTPDH